MDMGVDDCHNVVEQYNKRNNKIVQKFGKELFKNV